MLIAFITTYVQCLTPININYTGRSNNKWGSTIYILQITLPFLKSRTKYILLTPSPNYGHSINEDQNFAII
jgi:hypothetical protein